MRGILCLYKKIMYHRRWGFSISILKTNSNTMGPIRWSACSQADNVSHCFKLSIRQSPTPIYFLLGTLSIYVHVFLEQNQSKIYYFFLFNKYHLRSIIRFITFLSNIRFDHIFKILYIYKSNIWRSARYSSR